jgi:hypothetical protein
MRKTFLPLLAVLSLLLTSCSNASVMAQPPADSSQTAQSEAVSNSTEAPETTSYPSETIAKPSTTEPLVSTQPTAEQPRADAPKLDTPSAWAKEFIDEARNLGVLPATIDKDYQTAATFGEFYDVLHGFAMVNENTEIISKIMGEGEEDAIAHYVANAPSIMKESDLASIQGNLDGNQSFRKNTFTVDQMKLAFQEIVLVMLKNGNSTLAAISGNADTTLNSLWDEQVAKHVGWQLGPSAIATREQMIVACVVIWQYCGEIWEETYYNSSDVTFPAPVATTPSVPPVPTATQAPTSSSTPDQPPALVKPSRQYDMNDPNVKAYPIYATAKTAAEFKAGSTVFGNWRSSTETIAIQKNDDPDYMMPGPDGTLITFYDWRMKPIQEWVDAYVSANGLSYKNKTDYDKTAIIKHIVENGRFEEFIGLWRPNFKFTSGDCVPRSEAVNFLMIAMEFELFDSVHCTVNEAHSTNAYWDGEINAVRFIDADLGFGVWNLFIDELDEESFILRMP